MLNKKIARAIASCIVILLLLINLSSCLPFELDGIAEITAPQSDFGCYIDGKKTELLEPEINSYLFGKMNEAQRTVYAAAYTALLNGQNEFVLKNVDYQAILDVYGDAVKAFLYDYPEYFWLKGYVKANASHPTGSDIGDVTINLGLYEYWSEADLDSARQAFNAALDAFVFEAKSISDDYSRVKFVHDRMIDIVEYDYESYESKTELDAQTAAFTNSVYGALVEGKALCGGYAKLFSLIMHRLGYECEYITGIADGGSHAWNFIRLDGEGYFVDVTWDDSDSDDGLILYNYFCVNDEMIGVTHIADERYSGITSASTKYNYHFYESLYFESYDPAAIENAFSAHISENVISIRFSNEQAYTDAFHDLVEEYTIFDIIKDTENDQYSYMLNDDIYVLTFIFYSQTTW